MRASADVQTRNGDSGPMHEEFATVGAGPMHEEFATVGAANNMAPAAAKQHPPLHSASFSPLMPESSQGSGVVEGSAAEGPVPTRREGKFEREEGSLSLEAHAPQAVTATAQAKPHDTISSIPVGVTPGK